MAADHQRIVGTARLGVVARTRRELLIVTPDNGTITLIADEVVEALCRERLVVRDGDRVRLP